MTKAEEKEMVSRIKKDILSDLTSMVEKEVIKQFKDKNTEAQTKEITTKVILNLFKTLANRSSIWTGSL